jgi:hypothetical protein
MKARATSQVAGGSGFGGVLGAALIGSLAGTGGARGGFAATSNLPRKWLRFRLWSKLARTGFFGIERLSAGREGPFDGYFFHVFFTRIPRNKI